MSLQHIVWLANYFTGFTVVEGGKSTEVNASPVVTADGFGTTPGFFLRTQFVFGHWASPTSCNPIVAWRVAQILPRVKTLRVRYGTYDNTLSSLVLALNGDHSHNRVRKLATDLNMHVGALVAELARLNGQWPLTADMCRMWDRLPEPEQDKLVKTLWAAIDARQIGGSAELVRRIDVAELRLRTAADQKRHEDRLIAVGLEPPVSLRQFLDDIGVINLVYTLGAGDIGDPSHFRFDDLDREIMRELIGETGFSGRISLFTTTHPVHIGGAETDVRPQVVLGGELRELVFVHWDRVTERFILTLRPSGLERDDDSQDEQLPIAELRARIGADTNLGRPLAPGEAPSWPLQTNARSRRRRFGIR